MSEIRERLQERIGRRIAVNEQLAQHTVLKENTLCEYFLEVDKTDDLVKAVLAARELGIPVAVLGSGSYLSLPDETIVGLVIKNNSRRFDKMSMRGTIQDQEIGVSEVLVQAESGTLMNQLVRFTIEEGLCGLEYQLGLPGTVGGAIYTNAKYKKHFVNDVLSAVRVLTEEGKIEMHMQNIETHLEDGILLSAIFRLLPEDKKILWERGREAVEYRSKNSKH
jgi:UDP-N-acetylmuramate dehydrogenase